MIDTNLTLSLSANLPDARVAKLTRDLERDLSRGGIKTHAVETAAAPGEGVLPF